jgi:ribosomal protein S18 acetylase RimI-like enzyme
MTVRHSFAAGPGRAHTLCAMASRDLGEGYQLDDDRTRIDLAAVHDYLATQSYWAADRPLEVVEQQMRDSFRLVGLYHRGAQVGYCRIVSDGSNIGYIADVYVLPEHRGRGLGVELVREAVINGPRVRRWLLHTKDAQGLYAKFGFGAPSQRLMEVRVDDLVDPLHEALEPELELGVD